MTEDVVRPGSGVRLQVRARRKDSWSKAKEERFLNELGVTANITRSAAAAGMTARSVYDHRKRSVDFDAQIRAALDAGVDRLEMQMLEAALNGLDQPIVHQGKETGRTRVQSEKIMIFLLQAHRPGVYGSPAFRARFHENTQAVPVVDVEEAKARILALMDEMDAREAEDAAAEAGRIGG